MICSVRLSSSSLPSWHLLNNGVRPQNRRQNLTVSSNLTKPAQRFITSIAISTTDDDHNLSATNHLIRRFINSSSKSDSLNALSHLLSSSHPQFSSVALPLYWKICEAPWFSWNPKLAADLIAFLDSNGQLDSAQSLLSDSVSKVGLRERDLVLFHCNLMDSYCKRKSIRGFTDCYQRLKHLLFGSSSLYVRRRAYESLVSGSCLMDLPCQAENLMEELRSSGVEPSPFEYRSVVHAYGRLGMFEDMKRNVARMECERSEVDTVCSNMVLSSFGAEAQLSEMVSWLRRMKGSSVPFTIRTYNSVLNYCPTIMSMLQDLKSVPLSMAELMEKLQGDEMLLAQELIGSSVLGDAMEWNPQEGKLDLHGMHLASAYLIMLQWIDELRSSFRSGREVISAEITVVCGSGKHSAIRGQSAVKSLVKEMMIRTKSPLRIDRKNVGCFIAKTRAIKDWLV